ncbi:sugar transporter ERD6-like 5 isoform X5 [Cornus florida]|uniref:sugar transporter ERD6-like 5 isoform X5 n=1 Tax=Cornus florida TaxID=4283 RepID=UPI0028996D79|nr:sugar transporter ERD6-like 5 isoform X5 [Cornus florida]
MTDLGLSIQQYSVFGSIMTIGTMLGAIVSGKAADLIGRRGAMWLLETFFIMGWLAIIFAKGAWWLDFGRLPLGFGIGIHGYVVPVYIAEITPHNIRGGCSAASLLMVSVGVSLMFVIGNVVTWRTLAVIGTIPCLVQVVGLFFIAESPRYLVGVGIMLLVQFGGSSAISYYASSIFESAGCSVGVGTTAMAIIQIPFSILCVFLMDKFGRRPLLMVGAAGTCLGCFLTGLAFLLKDFHQQTELTSIFGLAGILVYIVFFSLCLGGTPWVIVAEIFPINIKGAAGSLVNLSYGFSSWIVSYAFNFLFEWSSAGVFFTFASICFITIIFVAKLLPETKGRTLEEIQASMIHLHQSDTVLR